jgi:hypothetical protein
MMRSNFLMPRLASIRYERRERLAATILQRFTNEPAASDAEHKPSDQNLPPLPLKHKRFWTTVFENSDRQQSSIIWCSEITAR